MIFAGNRDQDISAVQSWYQYMFNRIIDEIKRFINLQQK